MARYAIYFAPRPGEPLHTFGREWFGFDPEVGKECPLKPVPGMSVDAHETMIASPRHYGLHGTLKPPFHLSAGQTVRGLLTAVSDIAKRIGPVSMEPPVIRKISGFLALVPAQTPNALVELARLCVSDLDRYRNSTDEEELARRRRAGLTRAQEENLRRWGYPYVMSEFRFHVTLTGQIDRDTGEAVIQNVETRLARVLSEPLWIRDLCVFVEPDETEQARRAPMHLLQRIPLTG